MMNTVTETMLRRAVWQAASLVRHNARSVYTDAQHRAPNGNVATAHMPSDAEAVTLVQTHAQTQKTIHDLPGPDGYPIVGTAPEYFRKENRGQMHEVQRRFHARYGRMFKERLGPVLNVSIADPGLVEELLRSEGKYPSRPPYEAWLLYKQMRKTSTGIVSAQGEEWHKLRTVLNKRLLKPRQVTKYLDHLSGISGELVNKLQTVRDKDSADKTVPNVLNVLYAWAIECIGQVLIDKRFGCLLHDLPPTMNDFVRAIENMMYTGHQLMVFANVHKKFNTKPWRTHVESWDKIIEVAKDIIDSKKGEIEGKLRLHETEMNDVTFLEHMLADETLSTEEIYTNLTELLLSGVDTTSNTVAVALYILAKYPHVQDKIRAEVDRVTSSGELTFEDTKSIPYIKAFVKELLRFYPIIPTNARVLTKETKINDYLLPKNTIILLSTFTICRDPAHFANPDEFIPERWLRNEKDARDFSPFASLPFGVGLRSCVGRRIAENMIYTAIANITKNYKLNLVPGSPALKPFVRTVLTLGDNLPVEFTDR